ncbi:MAG: prephenate dehydratase [Rhodospirillales bacterium]
MGAGYDATPAAAAAIATSAAKPVPETAAATGDPGHTIAFQGAPGAYSDLACRAARPELATLPCRSFEDTIGAVHGGRAALAMIPIENSVAGRVADIHHLLPAFGLHIIGEHYQRVNHFLLGVPGARISDITHVHSHIHALNQCRKLIRELGLETVVRIDTAGAAAEIAAAGDPSQAVIASELAGAINGLISLKANIEDAEHNTTRFLIMARTPLIPHPKSGPVMTSFIFRVRNVPAALYKALGGFATNGVNMTKLESYLVGGRFNAAQFYAEVEGHPDDPHLRLALEELDFFTREVRILGVYPQHSYRFDSRSIGDDGD